MFRILAYGATHVGRERKNNEDAFRISPESGLYLVCDGMGGHASGEIASQIAADAMVRFVSQDLHRPEMRWPTDTPNGLPEEARILDAAVRVANSEVFSAAAINPLHKGMGTTVVGVVAGPYRLGLVHVGDSRIYRMRDGELTQLTEDHSLLNFYIQTRPMSADQIKQFAGKNVIVRAVGLRDSVEPDVQVQDYRAGDVYLLCTDGVTDMVDDNIIAATLNEGHDRLTQTAEQLIDHALNGGGKDNITVVLLQVVKVADESRARLASRSTLPLDADDMPVVHDELEDTSPGFVISNGDPSDAETLTEVEVRQTSVVRQKHAQTQEVPYRPWQQTELNAPPKPGVPLPVRRPSAPLPRQVRISNEYDVDIAAATEPHGIAMPFQRSASAQAHSTTGDAQAAPELQGLPSAENTSQADREVATRALLATTAKHAVPRPSEILPHRSAVAPRPSQQLPPLEYTPVPGELPPADDEAVTVDLPTPVLPGTTPVAKPVLRVRVDGMPYKSGGTDVEIIAPVLVEDTERVNDQARSDVAGARKSAEPPVDAAAQQRESMRVTAMEKPNPRRVSAVETAAPEAPVVAPRIQSDPAAKLYIASTPPPAPHRLTTLDSSTTPTGLPIDDDEEE
jgi:serine/threonine protein phosphatase PrpC